MGCDEVCTVEGFLLPRGKTSERGRWLLGMVRGGGRRPGSGGLQWGGFSRVTADAPLLLLGAGWDEV